MDIRFDTYYGNDDLNARLRWIAEQYPAITELTSLGKSYERRDIPLLILTNKATGPDHEKPAFWIDGNIHATELTASAAALRVIMKLVEGYGNDPQVTRLLDEQVFYIIPRLNPDGAAAAFRESPLFVRSGTRPYPFEDKQDGLHVHDMNGDGKILQMRIEDPAGDWKPSERDPRLMVKRRADEEGGTYYRLFSEGTIENYDGHIITNARPHSGLDFNRNFPGSWRPEGEQFGAGDFPGSEPEIRAVIEWFAQHPNIFGALTYHTYSRAILRPFGSRSDDEMDTQDKWVLEAIGARGTELTGYPCISVYHHFKYHPKEVITGVFDDWLFEHKGILAYTVELWDLPTAAGVTEKKEQKKFIEWFRLHPLEDDYKILDFIKEHADDGLEPWQPYDHPQLGKVEIGGWNVLYTWRNPPHALLEAEITPQADFAVAFAATAPRLAWRTVEVKPLGGGHYHLLVVLENRGFLPSYGSNQAKKVKAARPIRLELTLPDGVSLQSGKARTDVGYLEGRATRLGVSSVWTSSPTDNRAKAEWLIFAPTGGEITITAKGERAGTIRRQLIIEN
jgi:murein tripeptide amidase MpaA